jgi:lipoyl(octanoyl) transferase
VYVNGEKIAALGLRIRRGTCYHGLSFNIDMDLRPFDNIDSCGFVGLRTTQLADHSINENFQQVSRELLGHFCAQI